MLRAGKCADLWYCCLVQKAPKESSFLDCRVQISASISFQAEQTRNLLFPSFFHYILWNWLLWMFIPLTPAGRPGHLLRSLPVHKDEFFELIWCLLPCSEFFWSSFPLEVSCLVVSAGSPGQGILALKAGLVHSLAVFCVKVVPSLEGNMG